MEIRNPGGLYGRIKADQLGKVQPDTRNPVLAGALEVMGLTENRYSGIPTIRKAMREYGLPEPQFADKRGSFVVTFRKEEPEVSFAMGAGFVREEMQQGLLQGFVPVDKDLLAFCAIPRDREEICSYLGLKSKSYAIKMHVQPLLEKGLLQMTIPDRPKSAKQKYISTLRV